VIVLNCTDRQWSGENLSPARSDDTDGLYIRLLPAILLTTLVHNLGLFCFVTSSIDHILNPRPYHRGLLKSACALYHQNSSYTHHDHPNPTCHGQAKNFIGVVERTVDFEVEF